MLFRSGEQIGGFEGTFEARAGQHEQRVTPLERFFCGEELTEMSQGKDRPCDDAQHDERGEGASRGRRQPRWHGADGPNRPRTVPGPAQVRALPFDQAHVARPGTLGGVFG